MLDCALVSISRVGPSPGYRPAGTGPGRARCPTHPGTRCAAGDPDLVEAVPGAAPLVARSCSRWPHIAPVQAIRQPLYQWLGYNQRGTNMYRWAEQDRHPCHHIPTTQAPKRLSSGLVLVLVVWAAGG